MIQRLNSGSEQVLAYHLSGKVTQEDVRAAQQELKAMLNRLGKVRILLQLGDLEIPEAAAAWQDLKYAQVYMTDVERLAVVGDASWQAWMTKAVDLPAQGMIRFFEESKIQQAWDWVREEINSAG
ncbi:MAG: STAS/SEC14 domain-containing protein [Caldilineaceae bacterium]|nr:STAS/SEC14 domain-containing protein [Caldilineaceae bacterium]